MTARDTIALKPCPFCGGEATLHAPRAALGAWISCSSCGLEGPTETGVTESDAIAAWNRRAEPAAGHRIVGPADMEKAVEAGIHAREIYRKAPYLAGTWRAVREAREEVEAIVTAASPHMPVPAGWVLVPEEPTDEMTEAASDASEGFHEIDGDKGPWLRSEGYATAYRAMLASRPKGGA